MAEIRTVAETGSTNDDVAALAQQGAAEGLWLRAERQTGGRGRQGRDWHSPPGNLYASTLVRMRDDDPPAPTLALVAAVALQEVVALYATGHAVAIKWPNDILVDGAKLAGILLERFDDAVVLGFGVNLVEHPQGLDRPATSLAALTGVALEPGTFGEMLAESFARWLARWRGEGVTLVRNRWLAAAHPIGTALSTSHGEGLFDGLDENGALRLRLADGTTHVIHAGDVFLDLKAERMLLAIDAGNTNIVFALLKGTEIRTRWRIATDPRRTADEYAVWLHQLLSLEGYDSNDVTAVIIGTVVPRALHNLEVLASKYFGVRPIVAGQGAAAWGIELDVAEPHSVGADRALNAIAAHARHPGDLIVVDFGTATTFDVVDSSGAYKGGIIAPGINLSLDALVTAAAKLPRIAIAAPRTASVVGRTTEDQMNIGIFWGYVAMIEGLTARLKAEIGRPVKVISTGGLAVLFNDHTSVFDAIEPDLTITGLGLLYERSQQ